MEPQTSMLWEILHRRALFKQPEDDTQFLKEWSLQVPVSEGRCKCNKFWKRWVMINPPDFANYFEWSVKAHNAVNVKLGRPEWTVEQALEKWKN